MSWSARRKFLYIAVVAVIILIALAYAGIKLLSRTPTCFDKLQNQNETGIDCGGPCSTLCKNAVHDPVVLWTRMFQTGPNIYTAAAYVQNPNATQNAAAHDVKYAIRLFDASNVLIVERDGVMNIPPQETVPVIETGIDTGTRVPAHVFLEFSKDLTWTKVLKTSLPSVRLTNQLLSPDATNLSATVVNQGDSAIENLSLAAVLFDENGTAQAASKTLIANIAPAGTAPAIFTWTTALSGIVRAEITPIPELPGR